MNKYIFCLILCITFNFSARSEKHKNGSRLEYYDVDEQNQKNGAYESYYQGNPEIKGYYQHGIKTGKWVFEYDKNFSQTGIFTNGKPDSVWTYYYNGKLSGTQDYRSGQIRSYDSSGNLIFKFDSIPDGYLSEDYYNNGKLKKKTLMKDNMEHCLTFNENGDTLNYVLYKNDLPYTIFKQDQNGSCRYDGSLNNGTGSVVVREKNPFDQKWKKVAKINFQNSELDGIYNEYDSEGILSVSGNFTNGYMTGEWLRFDQVNQSVKNKKQYQLSDSLRSDSTDFFIIKRKIDDIFLSPSFPGGQTKLVQFIQDNIVYPIIAINKKIEGKVMVQFTVSKFGQIKDIHILSSPQNDLDKEAIRLVKSMPNWIPGALNGRIVPVNFTLPLIFKL